MVVGDRLRQLREQRNLSQGDIEERTGLLRCYVSRVENGHTVPAIDTLEKFARALGIPMYQLLYEGEGVPKIPQPVKRKVAREVFWGTSGKDAAMLTQFRRFFTRMQEEDRRMILHLAQKMHKAAARRG
jgi:transcriptional regulator with XRE-family HTH domain